MDLTARIEKGRGPFRFGGGPQKTEAQEIEELMSLGINHPARRRHREREQRKKLEALEQAWNPTPLRYRPPIFKGMKPITREPWAVDEEFYQKKTGSFETEYNAAGVFDDRSVLSASKGYTSSFNR